MIIQKFKKYIFNIVVLGQLFTPLSALADTDSQNENSQQAVILAKSGDLLIHTLNKNSDILNI